MNLIQKTLAIAVAGVSIAVASNVIADEHKSPEAMAIEYRQSAFEMIKYHFGPMAAMVKGEKEFNADEFKKNAEAVAALSKFPANGFIEGSDKGGKTEAKADIWKNMDDFMALPTPYRRGWAANRSSISRNLHRSGNR